MGRYTYNQRAAAIDKFIEDQEKARADAKKKREDAYKAKLEEGENNIKRLRWKASESLKLGLKLYNAHMLPSDYLEMGRQYGIRPNKINKIAKADFMVFVVNYVYKYNAEIKEKSIGYVASDGMKLIMSVNRGGNIKVSKVKNERDLTTRGIKLGSVDFSTDVPITPEEYELLYVSFNRWVNDFYEWFDAEYMDKDY